MAAEGLMPSVAVFEHSGDVDVSVFQCPAARLPTLS